MCNMYMYTTGDNAQSHIHYVLCSESYDVRSLLSNTLNIDKVWFTFHPFRQLQVEEDVGEFALCVDGCAFVVSLEHDVVPLHVSHALKRHEQLLS